MMDYLYYRRNFLHYLLLPIAWFYSLLLILRHRFAKVDRLPCKVVCVGGAVMGGAGKTPMVRYLADYFRQRGYTPHIVSRGYGRKVRGNFRVESFHTAYDVGDEALMLSSDFPVWVADDRFIAGKMAVDSGCDILILDDGYQNPSLHKDVHILVSDASFGFGNGFVFPSGCLREPLFMALRRADLHIILSRSGEDSHLRRGLKKLMRPYILADLVPTVEAEANLPEGNLVVFAGLARCHQFFSMVHRLSEGVRDDILSYIVSYRSFSDHHFYSDRDKRELWRLARDCGATLVTTEKDFVRFSESERSDLFVVGVEVRLDAVLLDDFFELSGD